MTSTRPRPTRLSVTVRLAFVVGASVLAACSWYAGAAVGVEQPAGAGGPTTVTVVLEPPDPTGLAALASQPLPDRATRLRQLASLVPSDAQRAEVVSSLETSGFRITAETTWSVTATATPGVVADTFGSRPAAPKNPSEAQVRAATGPLADVPPELADEVAAVYPTTGGPAAFAPASTGSLSGPDLRNAAAAAGGAPSTGLLDAQLTIATIQLSTWQSADLTQYAASQGLPDPVASGQYQALNVDGGASTIVGGDVEVDLDQQSILSTAPSARQRAYFAPNTTAGFADAFAAVYQDALVDPSITALSVSWGNCEARWGTTGINAVEPILESLVAAGVTVFAASGDSGIYDCATNVATNGARVDFPASSPVVVGVGGTRLGAAASAPNTGTNWTETAWSCTSGATCAGSGGTGGTGGGVSSVFTKPSWQSAVTSAPFASAARRMVPDIAAVGDPATGFAIYHAGSTAYYGGTSLAAPVSAAQLANTLCDNGRTTGVGDIHGALYQAYVSTAGLAVTDPAKAFRDVTVGSNGAPADRGADPSVAAASGYDTVSGLGGVLWPALAPYLLGGGAGAGACPGPAASTTNGASGTIANSARLKVHEVGRPHHRHRIIMARWSTRTTGSSVAKVTVQLTRGKRTEYAASKPSGRTQVRARTGRRYTISVTSTDSQGHTVTTTRRVSVPKKPHTTDRHRERRLLRTTRLDPFP